MRSSLNGDARMLWEVAIKALEVVPALSSLTCAFDVVYKRLASPYVPCWKMDRDQTDVPIATVRGERVTCELRVRWYHPGKAQLQACFTAGDEQGLQGLRDAGQRNDLRDYHRRTALLKQHSKSCTIDINRPLTLPPQVVEHIVARGPTELVPSGTPQKFKAVLLNGWRNQDIQRLAAWKARRRPAPAYGYRIISLSPLLPPAEAACVLGLCLAQEGMLDDATGQCFLTMLCGRETDPLIPQVWKALKLHFAYQQFPLGLRAYIKPVVSGLSAPSKERVFRDDEGNDYLPIQQAVKALGKHKTTLYRWIEDGILAIEDGVPVVKEFSYPTRSGVQKTVQAIARSAIERYKSQDDFEKSVIKRIQNSHQVQCASAKREYRRLRERLEKRLGRKPEQQDIEEELLADPKVVRYQKRQTLKAKQTMKWDATHTEDMKSLKKKIDACDELLKTSPRLSKKWEDVQEEWERLCQRLRGCHP